MNYLLTFFGYKQTEHKVESEEYISVEHRDHSNGYKMIGQQGRRRNSKRFVLGDEADIVETCEMDSTVSDMNRTESNADLVQQEWNYRGFSRFNRVGSSLT